MVITRRTRPPDRDRQLAAVAADLFRARGYTGVTVNDIAAAAGVTGAALYRHYPGKQALLFQVLLDGIDAMEQATARFLAELERAGPGQAQPDQAAALLNAIATVSLDKRDITALWRTEGRHLSPDQQREIARRATANLRTWAHALLAWRPELTPPDAELLCWATLSVFGSTSVHRTSLPRPRYTAQLTAAAQRLLHTRLPRVAPDPAAAKSGHGGPGASGPAIPGGPEAPGPAMALPRRDQLIREAAALFHEQGFNAVSMEDIGTAAGIAGPSIYRHFPSKAALLAAIARRAADRLAIAADEAVRAGASPQDALRRLTASYVSVLTGSPELAVAFSIDRANLSEADRAETLRAQRDHVARWAALLQSCHPDLTPPEAKVTVHAALTIANDLTRTRRIATRPNLNTELLTLMTAALDLPQPLGESPGRL